MAMTLITLAHRGYLFMATRCHVERYVGNDGRSLAVFERVLHASITRSPATRLVLG